MSFSNRMGLTSIKLPQLDSMDQDLRNGLWNVFYSKTLEYPTRATYWPSNFRGITLHNDIWSNHFKLPADDFPAVPGKYSSFIKKVFTESPYNKVYDLIEFELNSGSRFGDPSEAYNLILSREFAGYRIIDKQIVPITNNEETNEIESALLNARDSKYKGSEIHLKAAIEKLSDRNSPDYRNSFKESISAIESICQVIAENPKAVLKDAMNVVKKKIELHPALEKAFLNLYGYASDGDGIRHALWDESKVSQEDAKFMLVSASAFVNYLIVRMNQISTIRQ